MYVAVQYDDKVDHERQSPETKLDFEHKDFRFLRWTLRAFGFWHPKQACCGEKWLYPLFINTLFLFSFIIEIYIMVKALLLIGKGTTHDLILELSVRLSESFACWMGHTFTVMYFKSSDLEQNIMNTVYSFQGHFKEISGVKNRLNAMAFFSVAHSLLVTALSIKTGIIDSYPVIWSSTNVNKTAEFMELEHLIYKMNFFGDPFNVYGIFVTLSLTWILLLVFETGKLRLSQLRAEFLNWEESPEDAIYRHYTYYSARIHSSSSHIRFLFVSHNVLMIISAPLFCYLCVEIGRKQNVADLIIFIYYSLGTFFVWIVPLYLAERLRSIEDTFRDEVNTFCKGYMHLKADANGVSLDHSSTKTFGSRRNVQEMMSYLKERKSGLIIGGYELQLKLSMFSFYIGLIVFIIKLFNG